MKLFNQKKLGYNLQFFADGADNGNDGDNSGEDGDDSQDDSDDTTTKKSDKGVKTYTQEEIDDMITKRLERERKKQAKKQEKADDHGDKGAEDKSKKTDDKVSALEAKLLCFEHDVSKDSVSDVVALAKSYVDDDTDFEEAIEKVVKKYPQFVKGTAKKSDDDEEEEKNSGSWGTRQKGAGKKMDGVEAAFLKRNPGLKLD